VVSTVVIMNTPCGRELLHYLRDKPGTRLVGVPGGWGQLKHQPGIAGVVTSFLLDFIDLELATKVNDQENGLYKILMNQAKNRKTFPVKETNR